MKRILDIMVSLVGLVFLALPGAVIALAVKRDSPGPAFYGGTRVGLFCRPFRMWKFRTMVQDADTVGPSSTAEDDPRITRLGYWLRRYKVDELPQLWNVLNGEMSLVGPRPQVAWAVATYTQVERAILAVRPGMTDPASLRYRNEAELLRRSHDPDHDYMTQIHPEKMRLSLDYALHRTFWGDIRILGRTAVVLLGPGRGGA